MKNVPKDPVILLSFLNTELRDNYSSLAELCAAYGLNEAEIREKMEAMDYRYNAKMNCFR